MTDLARLTIKLEADNAKLQRDLDKAQSQVNKFKQNATSSAAAFGKSVGVAVGVGVAAAAAGLIVLVKNSIDAADKLSLLAQKTGISTEALSELDYAAQQTGVEDLGDSLVKFNKNIAEASSGSKEQVQAFKALGVSQKEIAASNPEQLFARVAEELSKYADGANKTALAQKFFGKTGADLIPLLNGGAAGLAKFREEAHKLGLTIGTDTAQAANDFNDSIDRLKASATGVGRQFVTEITPRLREFADFMSDPQTIENLSKFGAALASSLGTAVETVTALTSGVSRLYDFLSGAAPTELVDVLDKIASLEEKIKDSGEGAGPFAFLNALSGDDLEKAKKNLSDLIKQRDELFAKQRADLQKPQTPETVKPPAPVDQSELEKAAEEAAKKEAEARKKILEASEQAKTTIVGAELERRQSLLEIALEQQKVTYTEYQKQLLAIQQEGIDREIAQRQEQLKTADPAESIRLLAEIKAFQTKRVQVAEESDAAIAASNKKLTDQLQADIAAYTAQLKTLGQTYQRALDDFGKGPAQRRYDAGRNSIDDSISQQRTALENQKRAGDIDQTTFDNSIKALEDFHGKAIAQWDSYYAQIEARSKDFSLGFKEAFEEYADSVKNVGQALGSDLASALDNAIKQTADLAANTILWGEGGKDAVAAIARGLATELLSSLIKVGLQMATNFLIGQALGTAATAATAAQAGAAATLWAPAAIGASIATFGAADEVGLSAYVAALAAGEAATKAASVVGGLPGHKDGGYTGAGPTDQIAGVVHGQEFVVKASEARRHRQVLEAMNAGRFSVPSSGTSAMAGTSGGSIAKPSLNARIVNVWDKSEIKDYLMGPDTDEVFVNWAGRNSTRLRSIVAGA